MIEIKKKTNETEEQFLWRIGQMIDSGKIENWKSINDIVNSGVSYKELPNLFQKYTYSGLKAKIKFAEWKK